MSVYVSLALLADDVTKSHDAASNLSRELCLPVANGLLDVCARRRAIVLQVDICGVGLTEDTYGIDEDTYGIDEDTYGIDEDTYGID